MPARHWRKCGTGYKLTEKGGRQLARVARMAACGRWCVWLLDHEFGESPLFRYLWEAKADAEIKIGKLLPGGTDDRGGTDQGGERRADQAGGRQRV